MFFQQFEEYSFAAMLCNLGYFCEFCFWCVKSAGAHCGCRFFSGNQAKFYKWQLQRLQRSSHCPGIITCSYGVKFCFNKGWLQDLIPKQQCYISNFRVWFLKGKTTFKICVLMPTIDSEMNIFHLIFVTHRSRQKAAVSPSILQCHIRQNKAMWISQQLQIPLHVFISLNSVVMMTEPLHH